MGIVILKFVINFYRASLLAGQRFYQPWLQPSIIFKLYMLIKGWSNVFEESKVIPLKVIKPMDVRVQVSSRENSLSMTY